MILEYLPEFLQNIKQFKILANIQEPYVLNFDSQIQKIINNCFINTCDEFGLTKFEKFLNIFPDKSNSIEERRFKVLTKWSTKTPYTLFFLYNYLSQLLGENGFSINIDYKNLKFELFMDLANQHRKPIVDEFLEEILPLNLTFKVDFYNFWSSLKGFTYGDLEQKTVYQLSLEKCKDLSPIFWNQLKKYTWKQIKERRDIIEKIKQN